MDDLNKAKSQFYFFMNTDYFLQIKVSETMIGDRRRVTLAYIYRAAGVVGVEGKVCFCVMLYEEMISNVLINTLLFMCLSAYLNP